MPRKTALIIGNSTYQDPALAQLKAPDADVRGLSELLSHPDVGQFDEVVPLVNASEAKTRLAIATFFARAKPDDMLLLYFSGHGVLDDKGRLYLAAHDTQRDLPQATAISAAFVTDAMDSSSSRRQVLILDCCHSGAFARGARGAGEAKAITAATFEGAGYGRAVLTATDATQYAWEGEAVMGSAENSVFTHCVIEGLRTGAADTNQDGEITLEELYTYVYGEVVKRTPKQTPRKWSYNQEGEFVIARNPHPLTPPATPLPDDLQRSVDDLRPWVREGALLELERLLFGSAPGLAAAAHTALQKLKDDDSRRISVNAINLLARFDTAQAALEAARQAARVAREQPAQAERDQLAQVERDRLAQIERDKQAKAERERLAQVERERLAQIERDRLAQVEREQQVIAERERRIQARLAERQRVEREQQAQAEQAERDRLAKAEREQQAQAAIAARAQPALAAPPNPPPKPPAPRAADSTAPLAGVRQPTLPPTAATASMTGGLGQLLAARWLPVAIMGLGWALSRGLAQAIFPNSSYPDRLPWLINWLVGGVAGGYLTGLAMAQMEPNWQGRHTWRVAAAWGVAWLCGFVMIQAVRQYVADQDFDLPPYELLGLPLMAVAGALGGHRLGGVWREARPALNRQDIGRLTWGWGLSWLLCAVIVALTPSAGWVVAWSLGGLAAGAAGGAVTRWVAGTVRLRPDMPPAQVKGAAQLRLTPRARAAAVAIMAGGWGLGWLVGGGGYAALVELGLKNFAYGLVRPLEFVSSLITGLLGSWLTVAAVRRVAPGIDQPQARRLIGVWTASFAFGAMLTLVIWNVLDENNWDWGEYLPSILSLALAGAVGGYGLAQWWESGYGALSGHGRLMVAGAWAGAISLSYPIIHLVLLSTFSLGVMGWGIAGLLAGALGGAATLWVFSRSTVPPAP